MSGKIILIAITGIWFIIGWKVEPYFMKWTTKADKPVPHTLMSWIMALGGFSIITILIILGFIGG